MNGIFLGRAPRHFQTSPNKTMSSSRTYPTERRKAWEYAERMAPNDPDAQQKHFEKRFAELVEKADKHMLQRAQGGTGKRSIKAVSFETGRFKRGCSGFGYFNPT